MEKMKYTFTRHQNDFVPGKWEAKISKQHKRIK